ncbi:ATP-binding cassette domain-containing protein [Segetibacter sp. 3557_3]|nr:ATP-binding cassette domain-containing protein [Segetibacter sp. 3557_3]
MRITFSDAGKRFNRDWIFRHFTYTFNLGESYAITGPNGSGKSTLLQSLSGSMEISEGSAVWSANTQTSKAAPLEIDKENIHQYVAIAAPYLEMIEEMTATEFLQFHSRFKKLAEGITIPEILAIVELEKAGNKQIRYYSSGMKQRVKLAQAFFSAVPILLLDEPCTNLDESGYRLYNKLIEQYGAGKTIVVSSNDTNEYAFCTHRIKVQDFK